MKWLKESILGMKTKHFFTLKKLKNSIHYPAKAVENK